MLIYHNMLKKYIYEKKIKIFIQVIVHIHEVHIKSNV